MLKPQILLMMGILAVVLVAGCTTPITIPACTPRLVQPNMSKVNDEISCKSMCYEEFNVNVYEYFPNTDIKADHQCWCDIKECALKTAQN